MEDKILHCLFQESGLTSYDISKKEGLNNLEVIDSLNKLINRGHVIKEIFNEKLFYYFITESGKNYVKKNSRHYEAFLKKPKIKTLK